MRVAVTKCKTSWIILCTMVYLNNLCYLPNVPDYSAPLMGKVWISKSTAYREFTIIISPFVGAFLTTFIGTWENEFNWNKVGRYKSTIITHWSARIYLGMLNSAFVIIGLFTILSMRKMVLSAYITASFLRNALNRHNIVLPHHT